MSDTSNSSTGSAMSAAMEEILNKSASKLSDLDRRAERGEEEKTINVLGLFEVPEMLGALIGIGWNVGTTEITNFLQTKSHPFFMEHGERIGLNGHGLVKSAALATIGVNLGIKSALYINPIFKSYKDHNEKAHKIAHKIAPVLDELKGKHSVGALMSVTANDNAMIFAHRKRMAMKLDTDNSNALTRWAVNVLPHVLTSVPGYQHMWQHGEVMNEAVAAGLKPSKFQEWGNKLGDVLGAPLATSIEHSNTRRLKQKFDSDHSALEMVLELNDQVEEKATAHTFQMPGGHGRGNSYPLEEYIVRVMKQHQSDMSLINSEHTQLRPALNEDLIAAAKPLADAIRKGHLSALSLIRLIGEDKVIKKKGRAVATPDEVISLIEKDSTKVHRYSTVDSKEFYASVGFKPDELKSALKALEGEEKQVFASIFPDSILEEAGMNKKDITEMRDATGKRYARNLTETIAGIATKSDEELKELGLAGHEVKQLHNAMTLIKSRGEQAVDELKAGTGNANAIEHVVMNLAVPHINGDKGYFGTLRSTGREAMEQIVETGVNEEEAPRMPKSNVERYAGTRMRQEMPDYEADNENLDVSDEDEMSFADAEEMREGYGGHRGKY